MSEPTNDTPDQGQSTDLPEAVEYTERPVSDSEREREESARQLALDMDICMARGGHCECSRCTADRQERGESA